MKVVVVSGSPRRNGNTMTLAENFLDGVKSVLPSVDVEKFFLYDLNFRGCYGCLACKTKGGKFYGRCARKDELSAVIDAASQADGLILVSPIYFMNLSGEMRSFLERFLFPYQTYETGFRSAAPKKFPIALIYSLNAMREQSETFGIEDFQKPLAMSFQRIFSVTPQIIAAHNTMPLPDLSRLEVSAFVTGDKPGYKAVHWQQDCQRAFSGGVAMAQQMQE